MRVSRIELFLYKCTFGETSDDWFYREAKSKNKFTLERTGAKVSMTDNQALKTLKIIYKVMYLSEWTESL